MGLFFPRKISATCAARRPSTAPSALITCHLRWSKLTFGKNVFITNKLKKGENNKSQAQVNRYFGDSFRAGLRRRSRRKRVRRRTAERADRGSPSRSAYGRGRASTCKQSV